MLKIPLLTVRCFVVGLLVLVIGVIPTDAMTRAKPSGPYPYQLVLVRYNLTKDSHVDEIRSIVERAAGHGYTGIAFGGGFDRIDLRDQDYVVRLKAVKKICDDNGMHLIPVLFSAGYAGNTLAHDRMLAAGLPVRNVPFTVKNGTALLERDRQIEIVNGGFEQHDEEDVSGFDYQDHPGKVSFVDTRIAESGSSSLRFENFSASKGGKGRLMQRVAVTPFRCYRLSLWVKTQNLAHPDRFQMAIRTAEKRVLMTQRIKIESTQDWTKVTFAFNSVNYDKVDIWVGMWGGRTGTFWLDNLELDEMSFINVLRRQGTPFVVKNAETGVVYTEGKDYQPLTEKKISYKLDHKEPVLTIMPGGRVRDGDRLVVDCYQALGLKYGGTQTAVCMSEPKTYKIWSNIARTVHDLIAPDHYLLSMDEIRQGGWCEACVSRGISAAEILGDCITKQVEIIHGVNSNAEIFIWSDMLDPNHNARADFFLFKGDLTGVWNHIPKDLIIACWRSKICEKSLEHFDELGFRTIGCGYYDTRNLKNAERWMKALGATRGACGIMYTTWHDDYDFLEGFGDVAQGRSAGK